MALSEKRREWQREYFAKRRATDPDFKSRQAASRKRYRERLKASGEMKRRKAEEHIRYTYGLAKEEYEAMVKRQNGCCAICGDCPDKLVVDHNHGCGTVRGLLCSNCNTGIGMFRDSTSFLLSAIKYLGDRKDHGN
ncbi:hypothetical protein [Bradyrhizobium phage ppBeUSDA76-2]|uniref:endonuclease VII domain-containing protein n=1 Tax=Bradyrhizobium TaxID=374 RepID=UPI00116CA26E|nr:MULTISPECIES: endonuclease domain-containing protein [Bradyrhizobium]WAX24426.1 hypothetical protein [Bradyrhizobium phage ppBeUSDA76-2]MCP1732415.1 hypothetical protein [Bradyrhizobium elkanii]MCS3567753.1 hypothetical protein [Bradyrhizobium elkanii]MCS3590764.1 hypothetical protein [Bradyrhizobium elkanii]MCS3620207.1 hypothetical protein [Bradyrhizobium elkanii]